MVEQKRYIFKKRNTYYFVVRIPKVLQRHYVTKRIQVCLYTDHEAIALVKAQKLKHELEQQWSELRLKTVSSKFSEYLVSHHKSATIEEALEVYLATKGNNRSDNFFAATRRNISYLTKAISNRPLEEYSTLDASKFRDWLMKEQSLSSASTRRVMSTVKSIFNLAISELDLDLNNPFQAVYIPSQEQTKRASISPSELKKLQDACLHLNDERRLIIALLSDTGLRLNEALGLTKDDIDLESAIPNLQVRTYPWRSLKTPSSVRTIPLVGASLLAAQQAVKETSSFLFPSYANQSSTKSNSASAALNPWLKRQLNNDYVIHSLRHSFRDRLRAIQCPTELINELGGWSKSSVGEGYGDGYPLEVKYEWLSKFTEQKNVS